MLQTAVAVLGAQLLAAPVSKPADTDVRDPVAPVTASAAGPTLDAAAIALAPRAVAPDTTRRPKAVEYSDAYYTRLTIHRWGSYAELPLFAGEWVLGQKLLSSGPQASWVRPAHGTVAGALGVLFAVNTVTGGWNLWDARHDTEGRTKRIVHSVLMLAADGGFALAGASAPEDEGEGDWQGRANTHRAIALTSIGLATAGTVMMWIDRD